MVKKETITPGEFDLSEFDAAVKKQEEGILVPILHMDGKTKLGFSIKIAGPDSARAREANNRLIDALAEEGIDRALTSEEREDQKLRYLSMITLDFVPDTLEDGTSPKYAIKMDGKGLEFSEENALKVYSRYAFIASQLNQKGGRANFIGG